MTGNGACPPVVRLSVRRVCLAHVSPHSLLSWSAGREAVDRTVDIVARTVLRQLALGVDAADQELQPDDALRLAGDIFRGRVVDRPWIGTVVLMGVREFADVTYQPLVIVVGNEYAVNDDRGVVPRRHDASGAPLLFVPGRRDVGV